MSRSNPDKMPRTKKAYRAKAKRNTAHRAISEAQRTNDAHTRAAVEACEGRGEWARLEGLAAPVKSFPRRVHPAKVQQSAVAA